LTRPVRRINGKGNKKMKPKRPISILAMLSVLITCLVTTPIIAHALPSNTTFNTAINFPGTAGDENTATGITSGQSLFYKVTLTANQYVYFASYATKDYDLYFYNPSQSLIASSTKAASSPDYIGYTVTTAGTYYIELRAYSNAGITTSDSCKYKYIKTSGTSGTSSTNSAYSRTSAYTYANTWWNSRNTATYPDYDTVAGGGDCANFVSQCLNVGGMSEMGSDYSQQSAWFCNTTSATALTDCAITWRAANYFTTHWGTNSVGSGYKRAYECKYRVGKDIVNDFTNIKSDLHIGDVIQLTTDANSNRYHTLIVYSISTNDVTLACHTNDSKTISLKTKAQDSPNSMFAIMRIKSA
jgi:hypothetical protein